MICGKVIMVRGKDSLSEDWGEFEFLALPSPADRIMIIRDATENYSTVLAVHHHPCAAGSGDKPSAEIVAKWTGSGPKIR
ncbi:hypothetical protein GCM10009127_05780 [Alteraurantiacibacter aestuarii]